MKLTANFSLSELRCRDGSGVPERFLDNARAICQRAQVLRDALGRPLKVTSGYRSPEYNRSIKAARNSLHMSAKALDLTCAGWTAERLGELYEQLVNAGRVPDGGLGIYPRRWGGWIHIDTGRPRRWRG